MQLGLFCFASKPFSTVLCLLYGKIHREMNLAVHVLQALVFFACCHTAANMPLCLVDFQYLFNSAVQLRVYIF